MKSKKIHILIFSVLIISLSSCNDWFHKDIKDVSEISVYPLMELIGGNAIKKNVGDTWEDPGYNCSEVKFGDNDLNSKVVVDASSVDMNTSGYYFISYTVKNKFGYEKKIYRTVVVKNPSASNFDIKGNYITGLNEASYTYTSVENKGTDPDFYYSLNILNKNDVIPSGLVNYDDDKYCVPRIWVEYSGGQYMDGYAEYDPGNPSFFIPPSITFTLTFTSIEGNVFHKTTKWTKL